MAATEVRIAAEGQLRFVQASGYTGIMTTASGAVSKLVAYCSELRANFQPPAFTWIRDRGVLSHLKRTNDGGPYEWEARALVVNTGTLLTVTTGIATASGASVAKVHVEYKSITNEDPTLTAVYYHLHHAVLTDLSMEENEDGNVYRVKFQGWSAVVATASGYLG